MMSAKLYYPPYKPESIAGGHKGTQVAGFFSLIIFGIVLLLFLMYPTQSQIIPLQSKYIVQPNDSVWSIASKCYPRVEDEREVVYTIEQDNDIKGDIHVGQAINLSTITQ